MMAPTTDNAGYPGDPDTARASLEAPEVVLDATAPTGAGAEDDLLPAGRGPAGATTPLLRLLPGLAVLVVLHREGLGGQSADGGLGEAWRRNLLVT